MIVPSRPDRRRHKRYPMKNRIFAVVRSENYASYEVESMSKASVALAVLKSRPPRMGEIVEISRDGLTFQFLNEDAGQLHLDAEMDILFADEDFHLRRVPFRTIKETTVDSEAPFDVLTMRRLTVAFGGLTEKQQKKLRHVLKNYTSQDVDRKSSKQVWGGGS